MSQKHLLASSVFVIAMIFSTLSPADTGKSDEKGCDQCRHGGKWIESLNLSPEQQQQLQAIKDKNQDGIKAKKKAMKEARHEFKQAMESDANDKTLRKKHNKKLSAHTDFKKARFEEVLEIRHILTPEQRAQFEESHRHHRKKHGECRHHDK